VKPAKHVSVPLPYTWRPHQIKKICKEDGATAVGLAMTKSPMDRPAFNSDAVAALALQRSSSPVVTPRSSSGGSSSCSSGGIARFSSSSDSSDGDGCVVRPHERFSSSSDSGGVVWGAPLWCNWPALEGWWTESWRQQLIAAPGVEISSEQQGVAFVADPEDGWKTSWQQQQLWGAPGMGWIDDEVLSAPSAAAAPLAVAQPAPVQNVPLQPLAASANLYRRAFAGALRR
jgi:hypothetical protein